MGSQRRPQMGAKMVPKSIRSSPRAPLGLLWGALGLYFWHCLFNTIFERRNGGQNELKMEKLNPGPSTKCPPPSPSRTLPLSQLPLKGTQHRPSASGRRFPEYTCSDKGDQKASQRTIVHDRNYTQGISTIASHIY